MTKFIDRYGSYGPADWKQRCCYDDVWNIVWITCEYQPIKYLLRTIWLRSSRVAVVSLTKTQTFYPWRVLLLDQNSTDMLPCLDDGNLIQSHSVTPIGMLDAITTYYANQVVFSAVTGRYKGYFDIVKCFGTSLYCGSPVYYD